MGDPRRPAVPVEIDEDPDHVLVNSNGEIRRHVLLIFEEEDVERIRAGYCCIVCGESQVDHGAPFPEKCYLCGFPMRDKQSERFAKEFQGNVRVGPSTSLEDEMALAEEMVQREEMAKLGFDIKNRKPQIWVP